MWLAFSSSGRRASVPRLFAFGSRHRVKSRRPDWLEDTAACEPCKSGFTPDLRTVLAKAGHQPFQFLEVQRLHQVGIEPRLPGERDITVAAVAGDGDEDHPALRRRGVRPEAAGDFIAIQPGEA